MATTDDQGVEREPRPKSQDTTAVVKVRRPGQSVTAMEPLRRPPDDSDEATWVAYRKERRRRVILKAGRRARIARRESPHNAETCEVCARSPRQDDYPLSVPEIARRSGYSESHIWRVLGDNPKTARGKSLAAWRRIAHDGMGITLDEFAAIVLD